MCVIYEFGELKVSSTYLENVPFSIVFQGHQSRNPDTEVALLEGTEAKGPTISQMIFHKEAKQCKLLYMFGLNCLPHSSYVEVLSPSPQRPYLEAGSLLMIKLWWSHENGPLTNMTVEKPETRTPREGMSNEDEGRDWQRCIYKLRNARDCQQSTRSWGKAGAVLPHSLRGNQPCLHLELWDNRLLLFKLPQLWYIVTEALGNEYLLYNVKLHH